MTETNATTPLGNPRPHLTLAELGAGLAALPPLPGDVGTLALIVCRRAPGVHEALDRVRLTPEEGVPGDQWKRRPPLDPEAQLTVMRRDVGEMIACGQPLTEFGRTGDVIQVLSRPAGPNSV